MYESEWSMYEKAESFIAEKYNKNLLSWDKLAEEHYINLIKVISAFLDANIMLKEVLWNGEPQRLRNEESDRK